MEKCEEGDYFEIEFYGISGICNICIYNDDTGKTLFDQKDMLKKFNSEEKISIPVLKSGNYETTISGTDFKGRVSIKRIPHQ
ncbi:MAG: hypothetical protein MJ182_05475 [Treponema sp.]|nr:hypothetical protein [Treponema sp.]